MSDQTPPLSSTYELIRPVEVFVVRPPRRRYWLNLLLLLATIFSTLLVGARLEYCFRHNLPAFPEGIGMLGMFPLAWAMHHPARLLMGVPFAATLMLILLAHEMGHYYYCVRYGVHATLPFFIPAPTLIGTLGAFIRIKSPIRSRAALFDIGIAGPIAGFVVASITLVFALTLSKPLTPTAADGDIHFGYPLVFYVAHWLLVKVGVSGPGAIPLSLAYLHPTALAAWVGMFATALNLLPGGQLDGGHIVYAVFPRAHRWTSRVAIIFLLVMSWWWMGWLVWALLLRMSGIRHPQVPVEPALSSGRRALFLFAIAMLVLTFMVSPLRGGGIPEFVRAIIEVFRGTA